MVTVTPEKLARIKLLLRDRRVAESNLGLCTAVLENAILESVIAAGGDGSEYLCLSCGSAKPSKDSQCLCSGFGK